MSNLVYVISRMKTLNSQGIAHTTLVGIFRGAWGDAMNTVWNSTAIAVARAPAEKVVLIGEDGDVETYVGGKVEKESIRPAPVHLRNARTIDGHVYAFGMKRQVYQRTGELTWVDISAPMAGATDALGFEAGDGFNAKEIYAVGWAGEIWQYDGSRWSQRKSPVSVTLTSVCCAENGKVYAAGREGVLLEGRGEQWAPVELSTPANADFWDLCWFGGRLYVATSVGLFTLEGDALVPVDFGEKAPQTFFSLSSFDGVLWSVGKADVASFNGKIWQMYETA